MSARVAAIRRYPVKSMLGEELASAVVGERGLVGDRGYALVDTSDGVVASAKHPKKWAPLLTMSARYVAEPAEDVLTPVEITLADGRTVRSDDPDVDDVLSAEIGTGVRLVSEAGDGASFEEVWPELDGLAPQGFIDGTRSGSDDEGLSISTIPLGALTPPNTFFDLAVLHVLTTATLQSLSDLAPEADFHADRYRPNLLLDTGADAETGAGAFPEDDWVGTTMTVGEAMQMRFSMVTMRCVMTTLAQRGLAAAPDTLRTIAKHHRLEIPNLGTWACAGIYAGVTVGGAVAVGDPVG